MTNNKNNRYSSTKDLTLPRPKKNKDANLAPQRKSALIRSSKFDNKITLDNVLQVEEVLTCVRIISEMFASLPISLYKRSDAALDVENNHPVARLLRGKVNPYTTAYEFKQWLVIDYLTANFGAAIITRDDKGNVSGLWQQNAKCVTPERIEEKNNELYYNVALESVGDIKFEYRDVLRVVNFSNAGILGNSFVDLAQDTLQTSKATTKFAKDFFNQGISPDGFIEWTDVITDAQANEIARNELQRDLQDKYSGTGKFHQALLLPNGAKWVQVDSDLQKLQAVETRKFNRQVIASMLRVVPLLMGESGSGSAEDQWQTQVKNILPLITNFESAFNAQLLSDDEIEQGYFFKFNVDAFERGNLSATISSLSSAVNNGLMTVNEGRRKLDLPPVKDGDVLRVNLALKSLDHPTNAGGSNEYSEGKK